MISFGPPWGNVGIGNHFFMYSYMRLLAENLNYKMITTPITTHEKGGVQHQTTYSFENILHGTDNSRNEIYGMDDGFSFNHENIDNVIDFFQNKNYHIKNIGYFQKYSYWRKYKNIVKNYFSDFISSEKMKDTDIAIHLRNSYVDPTFKLDLKYYLDSLQKFENGNLYLFADDFNRHGEILSELNQYNPILMNTNVQDSLREMTKFNNIICSQGSFSFWAAFLSNARKIIYPITKIGPNQTNSWSIDYIVDDEERYEFFYI